MKKITNLLIVKSFLLVLFFSIPAAAANDGKDVLIPKGAAAKSYTLAVRNLTNELQDVFKKDVGFELTNLQQNNINARKVKIEGEGFAVFEDEDKLQLRFGFTTNPDGLTVSDLEYEFIAPEEPAVSAETDFSPDKIEASLMREIMNQIHKDYKTTNIVIAIDDYKAVENNKFVGSGEVRIGDMIWRQIDFNVKLDEKNEKAQEVSYKVLK